MKQWHRKGVSPGGFTLVEMLFTLAIGTFIIAGVLTSYIFTVKGFYGLSNYNEIQADGRRGLDWFARDLRAGMSVVSCTSNQLIAVLPTTVGSNGQVMASNQVTHVYQSGGWYRINGATGQNTLLAKNITQLTFTLYDATGNVTTQVSRAASVQVSAAFKKNVLGNNQTADFLSVQLRMRNTS